jgi:hypothetical protein
MRTYQKSKKTFKKRVKKILFSNIETKVNEFDINNIFKESPSRSTDLLAGITRGTDDHSFIGNEIHISSIVIDLLINNSTVNSPSPLYVTFLLIASNKGDPTDFLFKKFGSGENTEKLDVSSTVTDKTTLALVHSRPLATNHFRVLHKSQIRLACGARPELAGGFFNHRMLRVPINKKVVLNQEVGTPTSLVKQSTKYFFLMYATNPTNTGNHLTAVAETWNIGGKGRIYFKDI